jgi:hypothetical protein
LLGELRGNMKRMKERNVASSASAMASFVAGLHSTLPREQARLNTIGWTARAMKQVFALLLVVLIVPMTTGSMLGQEGYAPQDQQGNQQAPPPPTQDGNMYSDQGAPQQGQGPQGQGPQDQGEAEGPGAPQGSGAPQGQPMTPEQLGQLVAPIALYPDALVAQVLAASTYPSQVVEADRWVQAKGNLPAEQLAAQANAQNWDPSVKALVAFPSVLAQMDKNIQWTTDLGNAYYNQPQDLMAAVQDMRGRAQAAGTLRTTPQQNVSEDDGSIVIAPSNPEVVYVPAYNPWAVYGAPIGVFPGYYYGPPAGVYFGSGLAIGFGIGIGIGIYSGWGWGYHHWGFNWRDRSVMYNRGRYYSRSNTVYNRGWNRPGGPRGYAGGRGAYNRGGGFNRGGQNFNRGGNYNRGAAANRGGTYNRGGQQGHPQGAARGGGQGHSAARPSGGGGHSGGGHSGGFGGGHGGGHNR